jgi:hypothetical protein
MRINLGSGLVRAFSIGLCMFLFLPIAVREARGG